MDKKKLILDVVIIVDDVDIFELRFQKLYEYVDYFLIFGLEEDLEKLKKYYGVINYKIKTFVLDKKYDGTIDQNQFISFSILASVKKLYKSFEDYVFISYDNEIPDLQSLSSYEFNSKEVTVIMNDVYEYDLNKKRKYKEVGSVSLNFSHILKNKKNFFSDVMQMKKLKVNQDTSVSNGIKILNYKKSTSTNIEFYECPVSKKMIEYSYERDNRKFVFFVESTSKKIISDHIFNVSFSNKFPENFNVDLNQSEHKLELFFPNKELYNLNSDSFENLYKIKEIFRILSVFNCQNDDDIEVYYKDQSLKFKFHQIKNPSL